MFELPPEVKKTSVFPADVRRIDYDEMTDMKAIGKSGSGVQGTHPGVSVEFFWTGGDIEGGDRQRY